MRILLSPLETIVLIALSAIASVALLCTYPTAAPFVLWGILIALVVTLVFRFLWNTTMPQVFDLREITFWQAFRILLLAGLLCAGGAFHFFSLAR